MGVRFVSDGLEGGQWVDDPGYDNYGRPDPSYRAPAPAAYGSDQWIDEQQAPTQITDDAGTRMVPNTGATIYGDGWQVVGGKLYRFKPGQIGTKFTGPPPVVPEAVLRRFPQATAADYEVNSDKMTGFEKLLGTGLTAAASYFGGPIGGSLANMAFNSAANPNATLGNTLAGGAMSYLGGQALQGISGAGAGGGDYASAIAPGGSSYGPGLTEAFGGAAAPSGGFLSNLGSGISNAADSVGGALSNAGSGVSDAVSNAGTRLSDLFSSNAGAGSDALNSFDTGAMGDILNNGPTPAWAQPTAGGVADTGYGANSGGDTAMNYGTTYQGDYGYSPDPGTDYGTTYQGDYGQPSDITNPNGPFGSVRPGMPQFDVNGNPIDTGGWNPSGFMSKPGFMDGLGSLMKGTTGGGSLMRALGLTGGNSGTGTGPSDLARILGGLGSAGLGAYASNEQRKSLETLAREQMAAEQGRYTDQRGINQARYGDALTRADAATARGIEAQTFGRGIGSPSRDRYEGSYAPGFTMANDPGYQDALNQASKATLHGLSVAGNPAGSPNAWAQSLKDNYERTAYPALQQYRSNNATTGGFAGYNASGASAPGYNAAAGGGVGFGSPGAGANESAAAIGANANIFGSIGKGLANVTNPPDNSLAEFMKQYYSRGNRALEVP